MHRIAVLYPHDLRLSLFISPLASLFFSVFHSSSSASPFARFPPAFRLPADDVFVSFEPAPLSPLPKCFLHYFYPAGSSSGSRSVKPTPVQPRYVHRGCDVQPGTTASVARRRAAPAFLMLFFESTPVN